MTTTRDADLDEAIETDAIHGFFGLTYASYLVLPRVPLPALMTDNPQLPADVRGFIEKIPGRFGWSFPTDQRTFELAAAQMLEQGASTEKVFKWLGALYLAATNECRG